MNDLSRCSEDQINTNKMLRALTAIALEMEKFHANTPISVSYHSLGKGKELCQKLSLCKSNLKLKRKQIKILKQKIRNACVVAKTVMSAKEKETAFLHNHINDARNNCIDLHQKNILNTEAIQNLTLKNEALLEKTKLMEEFIDLGYLELQKMRKECTENLPTVMKLKEIMLSCGQYYADYSNELDTRIQLERKNRFLNNYINILSNNFDAVAEDIKNLRHQNTKLRNENTSLKDKCMKEIDSVEKLKYASPFQENLFNLTETNTDIIQVDYTFDLTSHLSLVKNLINNQDIMLKDLRKLTKKLFK